MIIYKKCNIFIKNCNICRQQKKNIFKKPSIIQIIPKGPRDIFQIDITAIPKLLHSDENC